MERFFLFGLHITLYTPDSQAMPELLQDQRRRTVVRIGLNVIWLLQAQNKITANVTDLASSNRDAGNLAGAPLRKQGEHQELDKKADEPLIRGWEFAGDKSMSDIVHEVRTSRISICLHNVT